MFCQFLNKFLGLMITLTLQQAARKLFQSRIKQLNQKMEFMLHLLEAGQDLLNQMSTQNLSIGKLFTSQAEQSMLIVLGILRLKIHLILELLMLYGKFIGLRYIKIQLLLVLDQVQLLAVQFKEILLPSRQTILLDILMELQEFKKQHQVHQQYTQNFSGSLFSKVQLMLFIA